MTIGTDSQPPQDQPKHVAPSRRSATLWSLFFSYVGMLLVLVRNLALVPIYLHFMGIREYGGWLATGGVLSYLTMVDLGLTGVLTQRAAVAYGSRDLGSFAKVAGTGLMIFALLASVSVLLALPLSPFVPGFIKISGDMAGRLSICFVIGAIANAITLMSFAASSILKGLQRTICNGLMNVLADLASIAATIVWLYMGWGLYAIAYGLLLRSIISATGSLLWMFWVLRRRLALRIGYDKGEARAVWKISTYQFFQRLGSGLATSSDAFLIGILLGPETSGAYVLTVRAHDTVRGFAGGLAAALFPSLAHLHGEGNKQLFKNIVVLAFKVQVVFATIATAGVIALNKDFVTLWVGQNVYIGTATNVCIGLYCIVFLAAGVLTNAIFARGELVFLSRVVWVEAILRIGLLIGLVHMVGVNGAAIAAVAAAIPPFCIMALLLRRRLDVTSSELWHLARNTIRPIIAPILLAALMATALGPVHSWRSFAALVAGYIVLATASSWLMGRELFGSLRRGGRP